MASPERTNLASTLRTFSLVHAQLRWQGLEQDLEKLTLAGNTQDLTRVLDACPLPCLLLSDERVVRRLNQAFAAWLHVDARGVLGQRLDNVMITRGPCMPELWQRVFNGSGYKARFNATYVSPGKVRTAQALAIGLSAANGSGAGACLVMVPKPTVLSPPALAALLQAEGITALFLTTALFNQIAREAPWGLGTLRHLLFGGEAVDPRWVREVLEKGSPERLLHVYGPTETTTFASWQRVLAVAAEARTVPIGQPLTNSTLVVLDRD